MTSKKKPGRSKTKTAPKPAKKRSGKTAPQHNPSRTHHLVAADQAIQMAERMLALANKAPKDSMSQRSAAMQAHAEATLAHQHAGYLLDHGSVQPAVRDNMMAVKRKAFSVARQAKIIVGAEKADRRRRPTTNPAKPPRAPRSSADADDIRRRLRRL